MIEYPHACLLHAPRERVSKLEGTGKAEGSGGGGAASCITGCSTVKSVFPAFGGTAGGVAIACDSRFGGDGRTPSISSKSLDAFADGVVGEGSVGGCGVESRAGGAGAADNDGGVNGGNAVAEAGGGAGCGAGCGLDGGTAGVADGGTADGAAAATARGGESHVHCPTALASSFDMCTYMTPTRSAFRRGASPGGGGGGVQSGMRRRSSLTRAYALTPPTALASRSSEL
mmetsp:Transcript_46650/g.93067  ORF Transcript_46650/g.93067 Transcript_46650/m.93067 type:complete len:229 (+) Transcript_46650:333-1019(+)